MESLSVINEKNEYPIQLGVSIDYVDLSNNTNIYNLTRYAFDTIINRTETVSNPIYTFNTDSLYSEYCLKNRINFQIKVTNTSFNSAAIPNLDTYIFDLVSNYPRSTNFIVGRTTNVVDIVNSLNTQSVSICYSDTFVNLTTDLADTTSNLNSILPQINGICIQCNISSTADLDSIKTLTNSLIDNNPDISIQFTDITSTTSSFYTDLLKFALDNGVSSYIVSNINTLTANSNSIYNSLISLLKTYANLRPHPAPAPRPHPAPAPRPHRAPHPAPANPHDNLQDYDIFIVLGQSNSVGRGTSGNQYTHDLGGIDDDDWANRVNPNIDQYNMANQIVAAREQLYHLEGGGGTNYGFGTSFARQYIRENKQTPGNKVLLIGCGWGGTGLINYGRVSGGWNPDSSNGLFKQTKDRVNNALQKVGSNSKIKGILWHQGENDVGTNVNTYKARLKRLLDNLRTYFVNQINIFNTYNQNVNDVKILLGGLVPNYYDRNINKNYNTMTDTISSVANDSNNTNYHFVHSSAISSITATPSGNSGKFNHNLSGDANNNLYHFSKEAQIEFGKRYFYVYNGGSISFA